MSLFESFKGAGCTLASAFGPHAGRKAVHSIRAPSQRMGFLPGKGGRLGRKVARCFALIFALVLATPATAQDAKIDVSISAAELLALQAAWDRWPIGKTPPRGFWDLQSRIALAVDASPEMQAALAAAITAAKRSRVSR
jgi:hypothetical protein